MRAIPLASAFLLLAAVSGVAGIKARSVSFILDNAPALKDSVALVEGKLAQPFMTWSCPKDAVCKPTPPFAPVMVIADEGASSKEGKKRELWVIMCPAEQAGFSPKVGDRVRVLGVVRVDTRGGVQLEHRATAFLDPAGKAVGKTWETPAR